MKKKANPTKGYGTGRRKTAVARVFLRSGKGDFAVNSRSVDDFFSRLRSRIIARQALQVAGMEDQFDLLVTVRGGGENGQAEAVRHGVARALVAHNPELKPQLRAAGLISRDSRAVERKKAGLRKARRSRQYSKR
jgi:small subunit ribosomal protein S9